MTQEDQILILNNEVRVKLAPSKIHGVGVHALRDIQKGERCYCIPLQSGMRWYSIPWGSLNKLLPEVKELILDRWPSIYNGSHFLSPNYDTWPIVHMNHSETPNFDQDTDLALKDIAKGEELTEDYRKMRNWRAVFPWIKGALEPY